nr:ComEC/Rec2 family competence protein [Lysinibacter cavernae]
MIVVCALVGLTCIHTAANEQQRHPPWLRSAEAAVVHATFTVSGDPTIRNHAFGASGWVSATLDGIRLTKSPGAAESNRSLKSPVILFGTEQQLREVSIGSRVTGTVRLTPSDSAGRVAYVANLSSGQVAVVPPGQPLLGVNALRRTFREHLRALPGDGAALLPGLALGDTSLVSEPVDAAMKASSLSHLTAVSGSNCAVIVSIVLVVARRFRLQRVARLCLVLLGLCGFVLLVTPDSSVLRAAVMSVVILVATTSGRPGRGVSSLCVAVIVLLGFDPRMAGDYGFILSVLATASILVLAPRLTLLLERWMPPVIAQLVSIPAAAQIACQPVLLLLQPVIPLAGIVANVLAAPAAPVATVAGLVACLVLPAVPWLGTQIVDIAIWPASWIVQVAKATSGLSWGQLDWPQSWWGFGLLVAAIVCAVVALMRRGSFRSLQSLQRTAAVTSVCALLIGSTIGTSNAARWHSSLTRPQDWDFALCDVGQGDAALVRSEGHIILIDTGPSVEALTACLRLLSVDHIELLVLTHYDVDHVGAVDAVISMTQHAMVAPLLEQGDQVVRSKLEDAGVEIIEGHAGLSGSFGAATWQVLWPVVASKPPDAQPQQGAAGAFVGERDGNAQSVTLDVRTPHGRGVFLGDLGESSQSRLLRYVDLSDGPPIDIVKVAHHGSRDQSARLYRQLGATYAGISVGADNGYGHPTLAALDMMAAAGSSVLRTDRQGTIVLSADRDGGDHRNQPWSVWQSRTSADPSPESAGHPRSPAEHIRIAAELVLAAGFGPHEGRGQGSVVGRIRGWQRQRAGQNPKAKRM